MPAVGIGEYSARKFELARRQSSPMMLPTGLGSTATLGQGQGQGQQQVLLESSFQRNSRLSRSEKNIASLVNASDVSRSSAVSRASVASATFGRSMSMRVASTLPHRSRQTRESQHPPSLSSHHLAKLTKFDANVTDDVMKLLQDQLECDTPIVFELAALALQAAAGDFTE